MTYEERVRPSGDSCWFSGTSQAAPHVAGLAALVRQRFPDYTPAQVADYLKDNAEQRESPHPNNTWGHGFAQLPPPEAHGCVVDLDTLTGGVSQSGAWSGECDSQTPDRGHARFYSFTLEQETEVTITLESGDADTYLYLREGEARSGTALYENDDHEGSTAKSQILETLDAASYTIEATTYTVGATGDFTLSILPAGATAPPPGADGCLVDLGTLTDGVTQSGAWAGECDSTNRPDSYARFYSFSLDQETEVQFDLTSSQDTFLFLLEGAGTGGAVVAENDDGDNGTNSQIIATLDAASYTIEATTYTGGATGDFTLTILLAGATAPPPSYSCDVYLGELTSGVVTRSGTWDSNCPSSDNRDGSYAYYYSFSFSGAADLWIELTSPDIDTYMYLLNAEGTVLEENDDGAEGTNSSIARGLDAGYYYVEATTYAPGETGNFTLTIYLESTTAPPSGTPGTDSCPEHLGVLAVGLGLSGRWSSECESVNRPGSYARYYSFSLERQAKVLIHLGSSEDTYLFLLEGVGREGRVLAENDDVEGENTRDSQIIATLDAGSYTLEATTYTGGATGDFTLSILPAGATAPPPGADGCLVELGPLTGGVTQTGAWAGECDSTNRPDSYARFYSFSLEQETGVQFDLTSSQDTFLFLLEGAGTGGAVVAENDDGDNGTNSHITITLDAGSYTLEATTYTVGTTGDFTLSILPAGTTAIDPRDRAKDYVEEAIRAYGEDPEAAKAYYQSAESVITELDLYLILLDGNTIVVNAGFPGAVGADITGRIGVDAIGNEYGKELAAADEQGTFVDYLIPDPLQGSYRIYWKRTYAVRHDGLVFAAGSWDKDPATEDSLSDPDHVVATIYKAGARLFREGPDRTFQYYNTPASIDGERYVFIADPDGTIVADATMPELLGTNISNLQASDDPELGQKIAALQEDEELWISHMWQNPESRQDERKHTYATRFRGIIFGSGYYGDTLPPPTDGCLVELGTLTGGVTQSGAWSGECDSTNRPDSYARFYSFSLEQETEVQFDLTSSHDTFLFLLEGAGTGGAVVTENDDGDNGTNSQIIATLEAGSYTLEATTYTGGATADRGMYGIVTGGHGG